jgi:hypothetical protein
MKIGVTVSTCRETGPDDFAILHITKIFDSSQSIDEMLDWARMIDKAADFHSLKFSEVRE